jgi:hypothetical protein
VGVTGRFPGALSELRVAQVVAHVQRDALVLVEPLPPPAQVGQPRLVVVLRQD